MTFLTRAILFSVLGLLASCGAENGLSLQDLITRAEDKLFCDDKLTNAPFASGDGSTENPYRICTVEQYNQIAQKIIEDNTYNTKSFSVYADLNFQGKTINLIGDTTTGFMGIFDGRKYILSNIEINVTTDFSGIFRRVGVDGVIKNVTVKDINLTARRYTGAISGYNAGKVESVKSSGTVSGTSDVGGLVGRFWAAESTKGVFSSSSSATVTGTGSWVGGLVGWSRNISIEDSFATGNIQSTERVGGLLGVGDGGIIIKKSYASGNVTATGSTGLNGGLVGGMSGTIEYSYSTGDVITPSAGYAGGLSGTFTGTITKSYSSSKISPSVYVNGGLVGYLYAGGSITNSYFNGEINSPTTYVGGLVGYNAGSTIAFSYVASSKIIGTDPGALQGGTARAAENNSFWDVELSGVSGDYIDSTTKSTTNGLSSTSMKTKATFINAGYDESIWDIKDGDYPRFKNQY